jgi:hypothetical protein
MTALNAHHFKAIFCKNIYDFSTRSSGKFRHRSNTHSLHTHKIS